MQLDPNLIELDFYDNGLKEINTGPSFIFIESDPNYPEAAGLYHHEKVDGKHSISLDEALLERPDSLIATIAHELSHVKLLGEKNLCKTMKCSLTLQQSFAVLEFSMQTVLFSFIIRLTDGDTVIWDI